MLYTHDIWICIYSKWQANLIRHENRGCTLSWALKRMFRQYPSPQSGRCDRFSTHYVNLRRDSMSGSTFEKDWNTGLFTFFCRGFSEATQYDNMTKNRELSLCFVSWFSCVVDWHGRECGMCTRCSGQSLLQGECALMKKHPIMQCAVTRHTVQPSGLCTVLILSSVFSSLSFISPFIPLQLWNERHHCNRELYYTFNI